MGELRIMQHANWFIYRRWERKLFQENISKLCAYKMNQVLGSDDELRGKEGCRKVDWRKRGKKHQLWTPPEWNDEAAFYCITCWQTTWQMWVIVLSWTTILLLLHTQLYLYTIHSEWHRVCVCTKTHTWVIDSWYFVATQSLEKLCEIPRHLFRWIFPPTVNMM